MEKCGSPVGILNGIYIPSNTMDTGSLSATAVIKILFSANILKSTAIIAKVKKLHRDNNGVLQLYVLRVWVNKLLFISSRVP